MQLTQSKAQAPQRIPVATPAACIEAKTLAAKSGPQAKRRPPWTYKLTIRCAPVCALDSMFESTDAAAIFGWGPPPQTPPEQPRTRNVDVVLHGRGEHRTTVRIRTRLLFWGRSRSSHAPPSARSSRAAPRERVTECELLDAQLVDQ